MDAGQTTRSQEAPRSEGTPKVEAVNVIEDYLRPATREEQVAALVFFDLGAKGGLAADAIRSILWDRVRPFAESIGWEQDVGRQDDLEAVVTIHKLLALWRQIARP